MQNWVHGVDPNLVYYAMRKQTRTYWCLRLVRPPRCPTGPPLWIVAREGWLALRVGKQFNVTLTRHFSTKLAFQIWELARLCGLNECENNEIMQTGLFVQHCKDDTTRGIALSVIWGTRFICAFCTLVRKVTSSHSSSDILEDRGTTVFAYKIYSSA